MLRGLLEVLFDVRARVGRGAELLDQRRPGWAGAIDAERIDMAHTRDCILGQVFGNYPEACDFLGILHDHATSRLGFVGGVLGLFLSPLGHLEDRLLRDAWIAEVRRRTGRDRPQVRILVPALNDADECRCRCRPAVAVTLESPLHNMIK